VRDANAAIEMIYFIDDTCRSEWWCKFGRTRGQRAFNALHITSQSPFPYWTNWCHDLWCSSHQKCPQTM